MSRVAMSSVSIFESYVQRKRRRLVNHVLQFVGSAGGDTPRGGAVQLAPAHLALLGRLVPVEDRVRSRIGYALGSER